MEPTPNDQIDVVLEELRPRMAAEKQRYMKRRFGVIVTVPLLLVGALAWAADDDAQPVSQVADNTGVIDEADDKPIPDDLPMVDESAKKAEAEAQAELEAEAKKSAAEAEAKAKAEAELAAKKAEILGVSPGTDGKDELALMHDVKADAIAKYEAEAKAKAEAEAKAKAEAEAKKNAAPSDIVERSSLAVGPAGSVTLTRNGATVSITIDATSDGWWSGIEASGGHKGFAVFSHKDGTVWRVWGLIEGDQLVVRTNSEGPQSK